MNIPNKVKIDGMEYKIIKCDTPIVDDDSKVLQGDIFYRKCEIRIDDRLNPQTSEMTLMHEIVHGIMHERNINMETPLETFVDELAKGFYNLVNDNPEMFSVHKAYDVIKKYKESHVED